MLQRSASGAGHHRVILSWRASAPSGRKEDDAVGYCLYRSKNKKAVKKNPTCGECEQINSIPITGTGCVDDLVKDGTIYYYVAAAINLKKRLSSSSNEARAAIPTSTQSVRSTSDSSYPLCRNPANSN